VVGIAIGDACLIASHSVLNEQLLGAGNWIICLTGNRCSHGVGKTFYLYDRRSISIILVSLKASRVEWRKRLEPVSFQLLILCHSLRSC